LLATAPLPIQHIWQCFWTERIFIWIVVKSVI
jgi:hypothetical protein